MTGQWVHLVDVVQSSANPIFSIRVLTHVRPFKHMTTFTRIRRVLWCGAACWDELFKLDPASIDVALFNITSLNYKCNCSFLLPFVFCITSPFDFNWLRGPSVETNHYVTQKICVNVSRGLSDRTWTQNRWLGRVYKLLNRWLENTTWNWTKWDDPY